MTTLDVNTPGELRRVLRGPAENAILNTLRHWPYWIGVEVCNESEAVELMAQDEAAQPHGIPQYLVADLNLI